ncbi:ADP,ATP carrier protein 2, chloroplastic-like isoform X2 [Papaver somniferum]|uniref:ADP,ATP carrier protein 2, chloroplastic-like isoform X2 n=1 Tax=Papaver somniferum TaxID=3469 RepID=UPI000E6F98A0|nr:ADP,ATP carrier protein 2, chloroplastic-like isoform X2 [Papaver somniferum]
MLKTYLKDSHQNLFHCKHILVLSRQWQWSLALKKNTLVNRTVKFFSNLKKNLGPGVDGWAVSLKGMMTIVVCTGLSICGIYRWVNIFEPLPVTARRRCVREGSSTYRLEVQDLLETSRCLNKLIVKL